jgi:hypothetical protein
MLKHQILDRLPGSFIPFYSPQTGQRSSLPRQRPELAQNSPPNSPTFTPLTSTPKLHMEAGPWSTGVTLRVGATEGIVDEWASEWEEGRRETSERRGDGRVGFGFRETREIRSSEDPHSLQESIAAYTWLVICSQAAGSLEACSPVSLARFLSPSRLSAVRKSSLNCNTPIPKHPAYPETLLGLLIMTQVALHVVPKSVSSVRGAPSSLSFGKEEKEGCERDSPGA